MERNISEFVFRRGTTLQSTQPPKRLYYSATPSSVHDPPYALMVASLYSKKTIGELYKSKLNGDRREKTWISTFFFSF